MTLTAYPGDAKTLLAFDLTKRQSRNLAGFTIECRPHAPDQQAYYIHNQLQFQYPQRHAQDAGEPPTSSLNAPLHKFRWVHVPGSVHQGVKPFRGPYTYVVTPRYFDDGGSLLPLDSDLSAPVDVDVVPFAAASGLELGFTRGYTQSQAYVNHFGPKAEISPRDAELLFDTSQPAGANAAGRQYTYAEEYEWLGFTARERIFALLDEVKADPSLRLDMFAYDLNEPDVLDRLLDLAKQGRIRVLLDNAALHHSKKKPKAEDEFQQKFGAAATAPAELRRGHFGRYAHDKVLIVRDANGARKVLTGSTNFSVTGLYVNSNHVLVFGDRVAAKYAELFDSVWQGGAKLAAYLSSPFATETFDASVPGGPQATITFAPHSEEFTKDLLGAIAARIEKEGKKRGTSGNVLFAVMAIDNGTSPVYESLKTLHANESVFSFGVSDGPDGISLYEPGKKTGVLVTGKPVRTRLPRPFNQVPGVGAGHQIHHKFVVCGFNSRDPVVYCGSSNLALGGEQLNGDNLLEIHDPEVVTAFTIEALLLVDHFQFLDRFASGPKARSQPPPAAKVRAAASAGWFLSTSDRWSYKYFDPNDLAYADRRLFA